MSSCPSFCCDGYDFKIDFMYPCYYFAVLGLQNIVTNTFCLSVFLSARIIQKPRGWSTPNFLCLLSVAMAWSSSDSVLIRYVLPVLWMTSCFHAMGPIGGQTDTALCTSSPVAAVVTNMWRHLTRGPSQHLRKRSVVIAIEPATMLWLCGGLCLEVRHTDVTIA